MSDIDKIPSKEIVSTTQTDDYITPNQIFETLTNLADAKIPIGVLRRAAKAFLYIGKIPKAWIDGKARTIEANFSAKVKLINEGSDQINQSAKISTDDANAALYAALENIIPSRAGHQKVLSNAASEIISEKNKANSAQKETSTNNQQDIDADWLGIFSDVCSGYSSDYMTRVFGKILAGEILRPGNFSIRTLRVVSQLDAKIAETFVRLASLTIGFRGDSGEYGDARIPSLWRQVDDEYFLKEFGITYWELTLLEEYGLISNLSLTKAPYTQCIYRGGSQKYVGLWYAGRRAALLDLNNTYNNTQQLFISGLMLGSAGRELMPIIQLEENKEFTRIMTQHLSNMGIGIEFIDRPPIEVGINSPSKENPRQP